MESNRGFNSEIFKQQMKEQSLRSRIHSKSSLEEGTRSGRLESASAHTLTLPGL